MKLPRLRRFYRQVANRIATQLPTCRPSSLRLMFTVPVLVQIVAAVGLVGYLSFRNGQQAVEDLATQLRDEISARIQRELRSYFGAPHAINRLNAAAFTYGELDVVGAQSGEHLLFQQMKIYPTIAFVYCGSARSGEFFGMLRSPETGELQLSYSNGNNDFLRDYYSLDVRGSRLHYLSSAEERYDSRQRPWYRAAIEAERPVWTEVYFAFTTGLPNVTAALPVYDERDRQLLGVCATDVVLPEEFRSFLAGLKVGDSGQAYVIDRQGNLISSSTDEPLMIRQGQDQTVFLKATASSNPLVSQSAQELQSRYGAFNQIRQGQQFIVDLAGERQYLGVLPLSDGLGLDWLIVVVVPESDFMGQIHANTRLTIGLCGVALAIALVIGILSTQRVTRPILQLNAAVKDIAQGSWDRRVTLNRRDEVGQLGDSVNQMAAQLQASFAALERQKDAFARFFPPEYLRFLQKESVTEIVLGDHVSREMAVMFSDIRYFTSLAEKMTPPEIFSFINDYLRQISPEIRAQNGFVVKFIGDGMMAVFPERVEDAIEAGIIQFQRVRDYNAERQRQGQVPIDIGISIHVGHLMLGMIGEHNRIQGDALSDTVNLAARLEGITKVYGASLLISEAVRSQLPVPYPYQLRFLDRVIVKGRSEPIAIYEVLDAEIEPVRRLKQDTLPAYERGIAAYGASSDDQGRTHLE
ncbi:diguanylate cyclase, partial [filamentous cyanobacterium CCP5]